MAAVEVTVAGRGVEVAADVPLHAALAAAGLPVESPCGGRGRCGRCRVRFRAAAPRPDAADRALLTDDELDLGFRLACRHRAAAGQELELLAPGLAPAAAERKAGLTAGRRGLAGFRLDPLVRKVAVRLERPQEGAAGDWERLGAAVAAALARDGRDAPGTPLAPPPLDVLRGLPGLLRAHGFAVTAVVGEGRVLAVEPGDTSGTLLGVALDIGTTTLAASLIDLNTGAEEAALSAPNPQAVHGADLMSRLAHGFSPAGREELRRVLLEALNGLIADLCRRAGRRPGDIYAAAVVGNTAMHHLFLGLEVQQLGLAPYVPAATSPLVLAAPACGLALHPAALVYCLPLLGGFVGSDLAGVLLATRLWEQEGPRLVVDLGTNGELLLGDREGLLACSAPAGPAFEGGAIAAGMAAAPGAIQALRLEEDVRLDVIGGVRPAGLCGSGLVAAAAALLRAGLLDPSGRLRDNPDLPEPLRARLAPDASAFVLARPEEAAGGRAVSLTQLDVRQLQLAKGAVRAGAEILLARRGIAPADLEEVLLAGTFGNYIREEDALAIGLLPPVPAARVRPVGNAAAAGALLALASREARRALEEAVRRVEHVPLAALPEFQEVFLRSTFFPAPGDRAA